VNYSLKTQLHQKLNPTAATNIVWLPYRFISVVGGVHCAQFQPQTFVHSLLSHPFSNINSLRLHLLPFSVSTTQQLHSPERRRFAKRLKTATPNSTDTHSPPSNLFCSHAPCYYYYYCNASMATRGLIYIRFV